MNRDTVLTTPEDRAQDPIDERVRRAAERVRERDALLVERLEALTSRMDDQVSSTGRQLKRTAAITGALGLLYLLVRPSRRRREARHAPGGGDHGPGMIGTLLVLATTVLPLLASRQDAPGRGASPRWMALGQIGSALYRSRHGGGWRR